MWLPILIYVSVGVWLLLLVIGILFTRRSVVRTDVSSKNFKKGIVYYYLPQSLLKITSNATVATYYGKDDNSIQNSKLVEQDFIVTMEKIADTKELLALEYKSDALMSDDLKYQVNDEGLLESLVTITDDRSSSIFNKIADAPKQILRLEKAGLTEETRSIEESVITKTKKYTKDFRIKASEILGKEIEIDWDILVYNELNKEEFKPMKLSFLLEIDRDENKPKSISEITSSSKNYIDGILTRPLMTSKLKISTKLIDEESWEQKEIVSLVDRSKLINVPIKRTLFAKRENTTIIKEGLIKSVDILNPSSLEGFASIPINVGKALISIPGQLISFKYNNTKNFNKLEKELLTQQKFQITKQNEIKKVLDEIKTDELKRKNISKIRAILQEQIDAPKKEQLDVLEKLKELKTEIEKLKSKSDG